MLSYGKHSLAWQKQYYKYLGYVQNGSSWGYVHCIIPTKEVKWLCQVMVAVQYQPPQPTNHGFLGIPHMCICMHAGSHPPKTTMAALHACKYTCVGSSQDPSCSQPLTKTQHVCCIKEYSLVVLLLVGDGWYWIVDQLGWMARSYCSAWFCRPVCLSQCYGG